jgi:hypothetical protein
MCDLQPRLHIYDYDSYLPQMEKGDILGREFVGEVVETGRLLGLRYRGRRGFAAFLPEALARGS